MEDINKVVNRPVIKKRCMVFGFVCSSVSMITNGDVLASLGRHCFIRSFPDAVRANYS